MRNKANSSVAQYSNKQSLQNEVHSAGSKGEDQKAIEALYQDSNNYDFVVKSSTTIQTDGAEQNKKDPITDNSLVGPNRLSQSNEFRSDEK